MCRIICRVNETSYRFASTILEFKGEAYWVISRDKELSINRLQFRGASDHSACKAVCKSLTACERSEWADLSHLGVINAKYEDVIANFETSLALMTIGGLDDF